MPNQSSKLSCSDNDGAAFTLIELLTVICILGMLLGLLVRGLQLVKAKARTSLCQTNLKQLGLGLQLYLSDNQCYPRFLSFASGVPISWPNVLAPLLSQRVGDQMQTAKGTLFGCPSQAYNFSPDAMNLISYGYNGLGYAFQGLGGEMISTVSTLDLSAVSESEVVCPSDMIAFGDGLSRLRSGAIVFSSIGLERWVLYDPVTSSSAGAIGREQLQKDDEAAHRLHRKTANVCFCDGHVNGLKLEHLFKESSEAALQLWNRDHQPHADWLIK